MNQYIELAEEAAREAGKIILENRNKLDIQMKDINNLVTQTDVEAEKIIIDMIHSKFPDHAILGEESCSDTDANSDNLWVIDPLDGTTNYANGIPHYSVSIAFAQKGIIKAGVVFDPSRNELFCAAESKGAYLNGKRIFASVKDDIINAVVCTGFYYDRGILMEKTLDTIKRLFHNNIRGIRRTGSAALDLSWSACSRFDAYFEYQLMPWDFAAGMLIVREAGGIVVDNFGNEATLRSAGLIVSNKPLLQKFLTLVQINR